MTTSLGFLMRRIHDIQMRRRFSARGWGLGRGTYIGTDVTFNCKQVTIGDGVHIGNGVVFGCEYLAIGDFATIYDGCFFPGPGRLSIGHNFWLGKGSIIDSTAGTTIGNNVGIGAASQVWTHMKFGDIAAGCRFHSEKPVVIESDVWLVGHVLVSPVEIGARSMAMLGSLVVSDIPADRVFAGVPAKDMTDRFGQQFGPIDPEKRTRLVQQRVEKVAKDAGLERIWSRVKLVDSWEDAVPRQDELLLNVPEGSYAKQGIDLERIIIRGLLPDVKFIPKKIPGNAGPESPHQDAGAQS